MKEEDGFLRRWSERKRAAREAAADPGAQGPDTVPDPAAGEAGAEPAPEPGALTPEEVAALPPVETVDDLGELRRFLSKGVPDLLRQAALRRIWRLDPRIRDHVDVALDYAYDWNTPGGVPGSGALVSRAGVARMADSLFSKQPARSEPGAAPAAETEAPRHRVTEVPESAAAKQEEPVGPVPGVDAPAAAETAPGTPDDGEPTPRPRRGHGGATPV
jgi:hypothetical protein